MGTLAMMEDKFGRYLEVRENLVTFSNPNIHEVCSYRDSTSTTVTLTCTWGCNFTSVVACNAGALAFPRSSLLHASSCFCTIMRNSVQVLPPERKKKISFHGRLGSVRSDIGRKELENHPSNLLDLWQTSKFGVCLIIRQLRKLVSQLWKYWF